MLVDLRGYRRTVYQLLQGRITIKYYTIMHNSIIRTIVYTR